MLLVNLRMDAVNVKENMRISWASEAGLVENIAGVIKEYKDSRNLQVCHGVVVMRYGNSTPPPLPLAHANILHTS